VIETTSYPRGTVAHWIDPQASHLAQGHVKGWLCDRSSLTARLKRHCDQFDVAVCFEGVGGLDASELMLLGREARSYWVREVYLYGDRQAWVFARSVMPIDECDEELDVIRHLAQRPLGEVIFASPSLLVGERLVGRFPQHEFCSLAPNTACGPIELWGRRTRYEYEGLPLVVTEVFLPGSPAYHGA
jgi:chorismate--pyruvate lyase